MRFSLHAAVLTQHQVHLGEETAEGPSILPGIRGVG